MNARAVLLPSTVFLLLACSKPAPTFVESPALRALPATGSASAASAVPLDAGAADDGPMAAGARRAKLVEAKGIDLGDFAVASEPGGRHAMGVVAALGWPTQAPTEVFAVAIDVATVAEIGRLPLGPVEHDGTTMITRWPHGVVVANQRKTALDLTWVTWAAEGLSITAQRPVPGLGVDQQYELRGFAGFDDRVVLASSSRDGKTTSLRILDDKATVLSTHVCHGGLFAPGDAHMARRGDEIVLMNMLGDSGSPVCAGHLHGAPRWHDANLPFGTLEERDGRIYFVSRESSAPGTRVLGEDLRPDGPDVSGPDVPGDASVPSAACPGLSGTAPWQSQALGGATVIHMISCCGDPSPGGLFVCPPAP